MQVRLSSGDYKGGGLVGETTPIGTNFIIGLKGSHSKQVDLQRPLQPFRATTAPFCTGQRFSFNLSPSSLLRTACETWYTFCQRYEACFNGH